MLRATLTFLILVSGCALRMKKPDVQLNRVDGGRSIFGPQWLQLLSPVSGRHKPARGHGQRPVPVPVTGKNAMFCMIPKVACTEFLALMMRLHGFQPKLWNPTIDNKKKAMFWIHFAEERKELYEHHESTLQAIMKPSNHDYVRAVFLRDPVERFVAAYLSKIKEDPGKAEKYLRDRYPANSSSEMVEMLEKEKMLNKEADAHFRSQTSLCNLEDADTHYDFIGSFNKLNEDAHKMIRMFEANSTLLDNGWGPNMNQPLLGKSREERDGDLYQTTTHAKDHLADLDKSFIKSDQDTAATSLAAAKGVDLAQLYLSMGAKPLFFSHRDIASHVTTSLEIRQDLKLVDRIRKLYAEDHELWMKANA